MDNKALYKYQARTRPIRVWFVGDCALKKGVGVCYELGFQDSNATDPAGVANQGLTDGFGFRGKAVMLPRTLTAKFFAGVVAQDYAAAPTPDGQPIEILEPPSDAACKVAVSVTAGSNSDSDGHIQCQFKERTVSGTHANAVISGKTLTLSGETFETNTVYAGDVLYISAGTGPKTGGYQIASVDSETQITFVNAPGDYAGVSVGDLVFVIIVRVDSSSVPFNDAAASGVFVDATGYGQSAAYAMQSAAFVATTNLVLAKLEAGNDDTGVIA